MALTNGGFDTGDLTGWTTSLTGGATATVETAFTGVDFSYSPHNGSHFLKLTNGSNTSNQKVNQTIALIAGDVVSGFAGSDDSYTASLITIKIIQGTTTIATPFSKTQVSSDWTYWSWTCATSGNYIVECRLINFNTLNPGGTSGVFDEIAINSSISSGINLIATQLSIELAFETPTVSTTGQHITPEQLALSQTFQAPTLKIGNKITVSELALGLVFQVPSIVNRTLTDIANLWMKTQYRCTLTGAPDSTTDLILPISSFQARHDNDPRRTYLSVVVPGIDNYIDAINARPNGRLKIDRIYTYLAGDTDTFEMANTIYDSITINQGGRAGSTGQISGFENLPYLSAETITLSSPVYRASENGRRRYRCAIDPRVRPGDTVTINSETFVTSTVLFIIDSKTAIMEVQELL